MKRKFSIYHFLVALMLSTLILPAFAGAEPNGNRETGSLTIHKYEREKGVEPGVAGDGSDNQQVPDDTEPLDGVTFAITQTHTFYIDSSGNEVWEAVTESPHSDTGVTVNGKVAFNNLPLGRYHVDETAGPPNIVLNPNSYYVDIPMTNADGSGPLNYDVHIYPKNETIRGGATLTKFINDTEATLDGVQIGVYNKDGTPAKESNGTPIVLTTENGTVTVEGLAFGDYYFKEIATVDGYLLSGEEVEFSVSEQGANVEVDLQNYSEPEVEKEVEQSEANRGDTVDYTITVTLPNDIENYTKFEITDILDPNLTYKVGSANEPEGFTFTVNGQELKWKADNFDALEPGDLDFTFQAEINADADVPVINNKATIDFTNKYNDGGDKETPEVPVNLTDGGFKVLKVDAKDNSITLAGAVFKLTTDAAGNDVVNADGTIITVNGSAFSGNLENLVTNDNGVITIDGLNAGTYYLHETKAPTYVDDGTTKSYRLLANPITVEISDDNSSESLTVTVENSKSGWNLPKTGGIGTMLFTFIGLSLMGGASFMFARRRNGEEA